MPFPETESTFIRLTDKVTVSLHVYKTYTITHCLGLRSVLLRVLHTMVVGVRGVLLFVNSATVTKAYEYFNIKILYLCIFYILVIFLSKHFS